MPIKWSLENDQMLLCLILEQMSAPINYKAIAEAWPKNQGDVPTTRAVNERVLKLRNLVKNRPGLSAVIPSIPNHDAPATAQSFATAGLENVAVQAMEYATLNLENVANQATFPAVDTPTPAPRQHRPVKTEQAIEGGVTSATGKRKRGAGVIGGIARMSKTGVYELPEPMMKLGEKENIEVPGLKKRKTLAVKGEDSKVEVGVPTKAKTNTVDGLE